MTRHAANAVREKMERLEARIPTALKSRLIHASRMKGLTLTDFALQALDEAAQKVIREQEIFDLSQRDQLAFANAILNPPEASPALKAAARRYRRRSSR